MQKSKKLLFLVLKAKEIGEINQEFINFLEDIYPNKSAKVLEVIERGITKIIYNPSKRIIWIAIGENRQKKIKKIKKIEYLIYPQIYCSCFNFYMAVVKKNRGFCKHIIAQLICEVLGNYTVKELEDVNFKRLIKELRFKQN